MATAANSPKIGETRRSEWSTFGHYGFAAYRIWMTWTEHGMRQRHEWKRDDGSISLDGWIASPRKDFAEYLLPVPASQVRRAA